MNRWSVILAAALIFATGAATGVFSFRALVRANPPRDASLPPTVFDSRFNFLAKLKGDLALDEAQSARIDAILQDGRKKMHELWKVAEPPLREEMKGVRERIQAELTPVQREKFDEMMRKSRERRSGKPAEGTNAAPGKNKEAPAPTNGSPAAPAPAPATPKATPAEVPGTSR